MAKGNGSSRASASGSPKGLSPVTTIQTGPYQLDGKRVFIVSDEEVNALRKMDKKSLREEAIRLNRGIYADEAGRSKIEYVWDILAGKYGSRIMGEGDLTKEQRKRLTK